jgi:hypothetical protein
VMQPGHEIFTGVAMQPGDLVSVRQSADSGDAILYSGTGLLDCCWKRCNVFRRGVQL